MSDQAKEDIQKVADRYSMNLYDGIVLPEKGKYDDEETLARAYVEHLNNAKHLQAEIDRLTAQNLQLRLICDRAMALVLTGEKPDPEKMTLEQGKSLKAYLDMIDYNDLEDSNSTEDMVIKMMIEPLVRIACNSPDETNLLSFAIAEQNRRVLVDQEIDQLRELQKLKPNYSGSILMSVLAFDFSRRAGDPGINHSHLINDYAPSVILAREAGVKIQPDDVERGK